MGTAATDTANCLFTLNNLLQLIRTFKIPYSDGVMLAIAV
jgi:hypothetical protein